MSMPTNAVLRSLISNAGQEATSLKSLLYSISFLVIKPIEQQNPLGECSPYDVSADIRIGWFYEYDNLPCANICVPLYARQSSEFIGYKCGTYSRESESLSYAICQLILGDSILAQHASKPFLMEELLFWSPPLELSLRQVSEKVAIVADKISQQVEYLEDGKR